MRHLLFLTLLFLGQLDAQTLKWAAAVTIEEPGAIKPLFGGDGTGGGVATLEVTGGRVFVWFSNKGKVKGSFAIPSSMESSLPQMVSPNRFYLVVMLQGERFLRRYNYERGDIVFRDLPLGDFQIEDLDFAPQEAVNDGKGFALCKIEGGKLFVRRYSH